MHFLLQTYVCQSSVWEVLLVLMCVTGITHITYMKCNLVLRVNQNLLLVTCSSIMCKSYLKSVAIKAATIFIRALCFYSSP